MQAKLGYLSLVKVRFNECDPMGHLNNAMYLTYLEQVAFDAVAVEGFDRFSLTETYGSLFVVRKHEITYHQPALENDWLLISSWGGDLRAARAWRCYTVSRYHGDVVGWEDRAVPFSELPEIDRKDIIVSAETQFAFMNVTTGRPTRIPEEFANTFFEGD